MTSVIVRLFEYWCIFTALFLVSMACAKWHLSHVSKKWSVAQDAALAEDRTRNPGLDQAQNLSAKVDRAKRITKIFSLFTYASVCFVLFVYVFDPT